MGKNKWFNIGLVVLVAVGLFLLVWSPSGPDNLGPFAQCLEENGATFYGAFWCPHCDNQKKMFGNAAGDLPYVECSTADGRGQLQACIDAGVASYPTWEFADGSRLSGEIPLETLAEKTGCPLPQSSSEASELPSSDEAGQTPPAVREASEPLGTDGAE